MKTLTYIALGIIGVADYLSAEVVKLAWDANPAAEKITSYVVMTQSLTMSTNMTTDPTI